MEPGSMAADTSPPRPIDSGDVDLSIVAPAHNEADNLEGLVEDVARAMAETGLRFELIVVDDGSTDRTCERLSELMARHPWLRGLKLNGTPAGSGSGQSAAFCAGIRRARGEVLTLMDADRQNDPADIPAMLQMLDEEGADMVQGDRFANRVDTRLRRIASWVGLIFRQLMLSDAIRDTGCSLRVFRRGVGLALPLQYAGIHRFIPFYARQLGFKVVEMPVRHRPRIAGKAKYGVWDRALPGLRDLIAVRWMRKRLRDTSSEPIQPVEERGDS
jgi:glycosyltransferase involved in cell wall biosynthesis